MSNNDSLSSKQRRAIRALISKSTIKLAAQDCGTSEPTIYRWLNEADFRSALTAAESAAIDNASRRLVTLTDSAINVVTVLMADPAVHPAIRLRAAIAVIENMLRLRELRTIEERLAALEAKIASQ
jgi:hypothetical protein